MTAAESAGLRERLSPLQDARLRRMFARTLIVFIGVYLPYTYLSQIYEPVAHGEGWKLALLMSLFGISGTVGNIVAGALADRRGPRTVVIGAALALTASFALVPLARETLATTVVAVIVTGWLSFSITAPQQQELIAARPDAQPLVTALFQASGYLAVSCSGVVGAVGLDLLGPGLLPLLAAALTLAAALFALATPPGSA